MYTFRHKTKKMKFTVRYAYNSNLWNSACYIYFG
jgi:uncharacterized membrane protein YsdA (DUF1294 family)